MLKMKPHFLILHITFASMKWILSALFFAFFLVQSHIIFAQAHDEVAVEGILIPSDIIGVDSNYVHFLGMDNSNQKINIRRIDFIIVIDSAKAQLIKRDNPLFAPYVRLKNNPFPEDLAFNSFRDLFMSKKSVMLNSFPYKASDYHYLSGIQLQKASRGIIIGTVLGILGATATLLSNDQTLTNFGLGFGTVGFFSGVCYSAHFLNQAGTYQKKASEIGW